MQTNNQIKLISVPGIADSILCPVRAICKLLALTPKGLNLPLFQYKQNSNWVPLMDTKVRRHFSLILSSLDLQGSGYTLHTFRRLAATFAFKNNVDFQTSRGMAPERRIVCGGTSQIMLMLGIK